MLRKILLVKTFALNAEPGLYLAFFKLRGSHNYIVAEIPEIARDPNIKTLWAKNSFQSVLRL